MKKEVVEQAIGLYQKRFGGKLAEISILFVKVTEALVEAEKASQQDVCGFDGGEHKWGKTRCDKCHQPRR